MQKPPPAGLGACRSGKANASRDGRHCPQDVGTPPSHPAQMALAASVAFKYGPGADSVAPQIGSPLAPLRLPSLRAPAYIPCISITHTNTTS
ncbi:hypothetical protein FKM82_028650 [Ascaphus truei]